jgi:hypothetical protein
MYAFFDFVEKRIHPTKGAGLWGFSPASSPKRACCDASERHGGTCLREISVATQTETQQAFCEKFASLPRLAVKGLPQYLANTMMGLRRCAVNTRLRRSPIFVCVVVFADFVGKNYYTDKCFWELCPHTPFVVRKQPTKQVIHVEGCKPQLRHVI